MLKTLLTKRRLKLIVLLVISSILFFPQFKRAREEANSNYVMTLDSIALAFVEYYVDFANGNDSTGDGLAEGTAWKTVQKALDTATNTTAGGVRINVEQDDGTFDQVLVARIDVDTTAGTFDNPFVIQGYSVTPGDGVRAVVDGNSAVASCFSTAVNFIIFKDLDLKGATGVAFSSGTGDNNTLENVKIDGGTVGFSTGGGAGGWRLFNVEITGGSSDGMDIDSAVHMAYMYIHDIAGANSDGINFDSSSNVMVGSIVETTEGHNLQLDGDRQFLLENTLYNATGTTKHNIGPSDTATEGHYLINNIANTATGNSINFGAGANAWFNFGNVIEDKSGTFFFTSLESTADPGFGETGEFNIGSNLDNLAYPQDSAGKFGGEVQQADSGTTTDQTNEPGAVAYEETGGGGGGGRRAGFSIQ